MDSHVVERAIEKIRYLEDVNERQAIELRIHEHYMRMFSKLVPAFTGGEALEMHISRELSDVAIKLRQSELRDEIATKLAEIKFKEDLRKGNEAEAIRLKHEQDKECEEMAKEIGDIPNTTVTHEIDEEAKSDEFSDPDFHIRKKKKSFRTY